MIQAPHTLMPDNLIDQAGDLELIRDFLALVESLHQAGKIATHVRLGTHTYLEIIERAVQTTAVNGAVKTCLAVKKREP